MGSVRVCGGRMRQSRRGIPGVLLVLLTLLCALYPAGLPASQRLGSAFSPATESVTIRPGAETHAPRVVRVSPTPPRRVRMSVVRPASSGDLARIPVLRSRNGLVARAPPRPPAPFSSRAPPVLA